MISERMVKTFVHWIKGNMHKTFVLDTSVLLHDPMSIFSFGENQVVIPSVVIEEIDSKKNLQNEIGRNAREVARRIDELKTLGSLSKGIKLENKGMLKIELNHRNLSNLMGYFNEANNDNRILAVALNLALDDNKELEKAPVVLVSKDVIMRIKADSIGIESEDYLDDNIQNFDSDDEENNGYTECLMPAEIIDAFYQRKAIEFKELKQYLKRESLYPNQFILFKDELGTTKSAVGRYKHNLNRVESLYYGENTYWGIKGKNLEQRMALEALLDDDIKLVTLSGKAGTGKTLLSLVAGLYKTNDLKVYNKLLITKPVIPVGRDIGYLPGDKDEKLRPWVQPIYDNLEFILGTKTISKLEDTLIGMNRIEIEALTYIRGRSIPNQFIIIDEAQNLTKHEIKTIITRVGEESKIVLMGDTEQIDHPYLDSVGNGLSYVIKKFQGQEIAAHVKFKKVERSSLAQLAAEIL